MASPEALGKRTIAANDAHMERAARLADALGIEPLALPRTGTKDAPPYVLDYLDNLTSFTLSALEALAREKK